ncbi:hypothetical protein ABC855_g1114 [[Candida] zeylanoides]
MTDSVQAPDFKDTSKSLYKVLLATHVQLEPKFERLLELADKFYNHTAKVPPGPADDGADLVLQQIIVCLKQLGLARALGVAPAATSPSPPVTPSVESFVDISSIPSMSDTEGLLSSAASVSDLNSWELAHFSTPSGSDATDDESSRDVTPVVSRTAVPPTKIEEKLDEWSFVTPHSRDLEKLSKRQRHLYFRTILAIHHYRCPLSIYVPLRH